MTREQWEAVEIGQPVYFIDGPGQWPDARGCARQGTVAVKDEDRWGLYFTVKMEDGELNTVFSYRTMDERGIGAYIDTDKEEAQ